MKYFTALMTLFSVSLALANTKVEETYLPINRGDQGISIDTHMGHLRTYPVFRIKNRSRLCAKLHCVDNV